VRVERICGFHHLTADDLRVPGSSTVFFDPADTEVGAWVGSDLIKPGCTIFDLASGSGAAAAAFVRSGAGHAHGIDISEESVAWAKRNYCSPADKGRLSFAVADFVALSTDKLVATCPGHDVPRVIVSNPAYVPLPADKGSSLKSIYGGLDGLKYIPSIIGHANRLGADLGITVGSYSSPRRAARLITGGGYSIGRVTLTALPLGEFSKANSERIIDLEIADEAVLWRSVGSNETGYLIVGLACVRDAFQLALSPEQLMLVLSCACSSRTMSLEALDDLDVPALADFPVRVLELAAPAARLHW
jgi:release factor glutamine methyltransferase